MRYKIEFETVTSIGKGVIFYNGENPNCKPADVPDEYWHKVERETDNPWQQYGTLKQWAATGEQLIRNVKLFEGQAAVDWKQIDNLTVVK